MIVTILIFGGRYIYRPCISYPAMIFVGGRRLYHQRVHHNDIGTNDNLVKQLRSVTCRLPVTKQTITSRFTVGYQSLNAHGLLTDGQRSVNEHVVNG